MQRERERDVFFGVNAIISLMMALTDDGVDAEKNVSFSLSASLSLFSALTLFSHAHLWSLKLSLKMRVSSNELFSILKNLPGLDQFLFCAICCKNECATLVQSFGNFCLNALYDWNNPVDPGCTPAAPQGLPRICRFSYDPHFLCVWFL